MKSLREEIVQVDDFDIHLLYKDIQNINIRIDKDGNILVSLPYYGAKDKAIAFVREKANWLRKHLAEQEKPALPVPDNGFDGTNIWLWGKHYTATFEKAVGKEEVLLQEKELVFTYKGNLTPRKQAMLVEKFYCQCMLEMTARQLQIWQPKVGLYATSWKLRRLKSKWGRCNTRTGELLFNISLVHRPLVCLEYVVLHELAHLYEPRHSERFYSFVSSFMQDWQARRTLVNKFVFKLD